MGGEAGADRRVIGQVHDPVEVTGAPSGDDLEACWDLGATVAANLL